MRRTVQSSGDRIFAIFSALRGYRPRNLGAAQRASEFSHGLQQLCTAPKRPENAPVLREVDAGQNSRFLNFDVDRVGGSAMVKLYFSIIVLTLSGLSGVWAGVIDDHYQACLKQCLNGHGAFSTKPWCEQECGEAIGLGAA